MFDSTQIKEQISFYVKKGITDFVIFPFGENGEIARAVLVHSYGITPVALVDNVLSKTNDGIISFTELKNIYISHWHIIFTLESEEYHDTLKEDIKSIAAEDSIIDLLEYQKTNLHDYKKRIKNKLRLDFILPKKNDYFSESKGNKIRTRIVHSRTQTWNTIASICDAVNKDEDMDLLVIIGWDRREECEIQVRKHGYRYIWWEDYDADVDRPDILVLSQPYDVVTKLTGIRKNAKLVVVTNTLLIRNTQGLSRFYDVQREGFGRFEPDYFLCDSLLYQDIKDSYNLKAELVEMGNAKFDGIYNACREKRYPADMKKAEGKKTVLWATDHGIFSKTIMHTTFDLFVGLLLQYFSEHKDLCLIIRLHHELMIELVDAGYWEKSDCEAFIEYCDSTDNVIFDTSETYDSAYSISDAIITDSCCGVTVSALPTLKPICATSRSDYEEPFHPELTDHYYKASSAEELLYYLEMIRKGEDPMKDERKKTADRFVMHFDGKNGCRIKDFLKQKYKDFK